MRVQQKWNYVSSVNFNLLPEPILALGIEVHFWNTVFKAKNITLRAKIGLS
jgi:hypothetical protein